MNDFQTRCWELCEDVLQREGLAYAGPIRIDGKRESYYLVQLEREATAVDLYLYINEAGAIGYVQRLMKQDAPFVASHQ